jgi:hypothetical protein
MKILRELRKIWILRNRKGNLEFSDKYVWKSIFGEILNYFMNFHGFINVK